MFVAAVLVAALTCAWAADAPPVTVSLPQELFAVLPTDPPELWQYTPSADLDLLSLRFALATTLVRVAVNRTGNASSAYWGKSYPELVPVSRTGADVGVFLSNDIHREVLAAHNGSVDSLTTMANDLLRNFKRGIASLRADVPGRPDLNVCYVKLGWAGGVPFLNLVNEDSVSGRLRNYGEWESFQTELLQGFLKPGDAAVDVGAHIGTHTVAFSRAVGRNGSVFAFEAQPALFDVLKLNAQFAGSSGIFLYNAAVGGGWDPKDGNATRSLSVRALSTDVPENVGLGDVGFKNNLGGLSLLGCRAREAADQALAVDDPSWREWAEECRADDDNATHVWVDLLSVDGLGFGDTLPCPALIKVDVEGMETAVLAGAVDTLARCRPVLHLECNVAFASGPLMRALVDAQYDMYWETATFVNANNYYGVPRESAWDAAHSGNTVYVSVNVLAIPKGYNLTTLQPITRELLSVLTPVDPARPLLADYLPVTVLDGVESSIRSAYATLDGVEGAFLVKRPLQVVTVPFKLDQM